ARLCVVRVTLLGPQRRPTLDTVAASLYPEGPVATITAGWQEREPDDGELGKLLGARDVNLGLYRRLLDVQERDPEFALGERRLAPPPLSSRAGTWACWRTPSTCSTSPHRCGRR